MPNKFLSFVKNEVVLLAAFVLAAVSVFFVPPDAAYAGYIDWRTLAILFCLMVIMAGLQRLDVFRQVGEALIRRARSARALAMVLMLLCYLFSMFITNDVALLTFVPFTIVVLRMAGQEKQLIPVIVLETIAANLGSMLTPIGNPQNLYLYSLSGLTLPAFIQLMLPYGLAALALLCVLCVILNPRTPAALDMQGDYARTAPEKRRLGMYIALFAVSLLTVARVLAWPIAFGVVLLAVLAFDRRTLMRADYSLLLTFIFLFIFIGNMKRIPAVSDLLGGLVTSHEVLCGVLASQVISNVPAAVLLSGFTENIAGLLVGTNLGGLGTLIASMASLISFKQYGYVADADRKRYILVFTALNLLMLAVLLGENALINIWR